MHTATIPLYITEPALIPPEQVSPHLQGTPFYVVPGDTSFSNSLAQPYETIIIRSATKVTNRIRDFFPHLKQVVRVGVGLDNIDTAFCRAQGIQIFNAPGANADAVSEYVVGMVVITLRKIHRLQRQDIMTWNRRKFVGQAVADQTVGIIGFGNIGRLLYGKLRGLGCQRFLIHDPYLPEDAVLETDCQKVSLDELLRTSTVVSLHLPLTKETAYLLGGRNLLLIQPGAIIVNAARGGIVDEKALLELFPEKHWTYIADTVENEPHVDPALLAHEDIIITPHIAGLTEASEQALIRIAIDNFLEGKVVQV